MPSEARRGRTEILGDIISAAYEEKSKYGEAMLTRVQSTSNIPFPRFKEYVELLRAKGLIHTEVVGNHTKLELTDSGRSYLSQYERMKKFLSSFGLD
jgi:predicted transcriptional regulator